METKQDAWDFQLLDTGDGYRLEKWGEVVLQRPDPQILWLKSLSENDWKQAWAVFTTGRGSDKGKWNIKFPLPEPWLLKFKDIVFRLKLTPFKHTGIFAEQAAQWDWMFSKLNNLVVSNRPKILNLFAYTGGATMVLAKQGYQVTHVDASRPAISWANENAKLNRLSKDSVRWILDDAAKFVKRELKRGSQYDGILLDPPAFGHSPSGKTWKFTEDVPSLLNDCVKLLSKNAAFLLVNAYATNASALSLNNLLEDITRSLGGKVESGELCLKQTNQRLISTGIFARWSP